MDGPDDTLAMAASAVCAFAARAAFAMSDTDLRSSLDRLQRVATMLAGAMAAIVQEASGRDLPHADGAASTVVWLRDLLRVPATDAGRMVTLGQLTDQRTAIAVAIGSGTVNPGQAQWNLRRTCHRGVVDP